MSCDADGMTSTTALTSSPLAGRSRYVEQQPGKPGIVVEYLSLHKFISYIWQTKCFITT